MPANQHVMLLEHNPFTYAAVPTTANGEGSDGEGCGWDLCNHETIRGACVFFSGSAEACSSITFSWPHALINAATSCVAMSIHPPYLPHVLLQPGCSMRYWPRRLV